MNVLLLLGVLLLVSYGAHRIAVRVLGVEGVGFLSRRFLAEAGRSSRTRRLLVCAAGPLAGYLLLIGLCAAALYTTREYAAVLQPLPGSPAEAAGVRAGDRVIAAGAVPVESFGDLKARVDAAGNGPIPITLRRDGRAIEMVLSPDDRGHIGVTANGERLPMKLSRLASSLWYPIFITVRSVEVLGQMVEGSVPTKYLLTSVPEARQAAPAVSAPGWWLFVVAESATLAWTLLVLGTAGCALVAERRLASTGPRAEGA